MTLNIPPHMQWLVKSGETIASNNGFWSGPTERGRPQSLVFKIMSIGHSNE
jgi:hypothetical protein